MLARVPGSAILVVLLTAGGGLAQVKDKKADDKEPTSTQIIEVGGKNLEEWVKDIPNRDRSKGELAIRMILQFSADRAYLAVPALLKEMGKHSDSYPLDIGMRANLPLALGTILSSTKDPDPKFVHEAVTLLKRFMGDSQAAVRLRAANALALLGPEAQLAVPELLANLKGTSSWELRQASAHALARIAYDNKSAPDTKVLVALFGCLKDPASAVRLAGLQSLLFLGIPGANQAIRSQFIGAIKPVALQDPDPTVQVWANMAIVGSSDKGDLQHLGMLVKFFQHKDLAIRVQAIESVGYLEAKGKPALKYLADNLEDKEPAVVRASIIAIGQLDSGSLSPAYRLLGKSELPIRLQAIEACGVLGIKAKGAVRGLTDNLADKETGIVLASMIALSQMGAWALDAVPELQKIVEDPKQPEPMKRAAKAAIEHIVKGKKTLEKES